MSTRPRKKVTYSLPTELVEAVTSVVRDGAAPSYSAFVEQSLAEGVRNARERILADAFRDAAHDPDFLEDVEHSMRSFRHADADLRDNGE
jgi:Arc/MetJ-type ribon-helix-helix transcriptional regulator